MRIHTCEWTEHLKSGYPLEEVKSSMTHLNSDRLIQGVYSGKLVSVIIRKSKMPISLRIYNFYQKMGEKAIIQTSLFHLGWSSQRSSDIYINNLRVFYSDPSQRKVADAFPNISYNEHPILGFDWILKSGYQLGDVYRSVTHLIIYRMAQVVPSGIFVSMIIGKSKTSISLIT